MASWPLLLLCILAPASALVAPSQAKPGMGALSTQQLLKQESDRIQQRIDRVDQALTDGTGLADASGGFHLLEGLSPPPVVEGQLIMAEAKPEQLQPGGPVGSEWGPQPGQPTQPFQPPQPGQPAFGQPAPPGQPQFGQPAPGQPQFGQPGQPQFGQPVPGQPQFGQPAPGQPQFGQPATVGGQPGQPAPGQGWQWGFPAAGEAQWGQQFGYPPADPNLPTWYQPGKITYSNGNWSNTTDIAWSQNESNSRGILDTLSEWDKDHGAYTIPRRNKITLAAIELVPFLGAFGLDRLYLGQPVMAALKATSFVCTAGVVGGVWAIIDASIIARNCLKERTEIDEFGFFALFQNTKFELKATAAMGGLMFLSWALHIIWFFYAVYRFITRRRFKNHGDPDLPKGTVLDTREDPFLTEAGNFQNHAIPLKQDPFLSSLPAYEQGPAGPTSHHYNAGGGGLPAPTFGNPASLNQTFAPDGQPAGPFNIGGSALRQDEAADYL